MSLSESLQRGPAPIYLVMGDATALVEQAVGEIVAFGRQRAEPLGFNAVSQRGNEPDALKAVLSARTLPMMAPLRLVEIRGLDAADDAVLEAIVSYAGDPSPTTLMVLSAGKLRGARKKTDTDWARVLPKAVEAVGEVLRLSAADVSPARYAHDVAARHGKKLPRRAAELLVQVVGSDLQRIEREVEKLVVFVGDAEAIDGEDVENACSLLAEAEVWDLTAGIAAADPERAIASLQRLLEGGHAPHQLIALVAWQLRSLYSAIAAMRGGATERQAARAGGMRGGRLSYVDPRVLRNTAALDVAGAVDRIAATNHAMNSRRAGDRRAFEALVLELCAPSR